MATVVVYLLISRTHSLIGHFPWIQPRVAMEVTTTHVSFTMYALQDNEQLENKGKNCNDVLLCHLNINSIQNKLEELVAIIRKLKAHIIFINSQFLAIPYTAMTGRRVEVAFWSMHQHYYHVKG